MTDQIYNPGQPYLLAVPGGLSPGRIIHLNGTFSTNATSLVLKFQSGPYGDPNDDIGLCIYARLNEGILGMNVFMRATGWGQEEVISSQGLSRGQPFEIAILVDPNKFNIAINRQHMGEFSHRLDPSYLSHVNIASSSNDLIVQCLWIEDPSMAQPVSPPMQAPYSESHSTPYGQQSYPPDYNASSHPKSKGSKGLLGMVGSAGTAVAGALGASHLLGKSKGYPSHAGGYGGVPNYGGSPGYQPQYGGYPGGHKGGGGGGLLNKAMALGGGVLGAKAMKSGYPSHKGGYSGVPNYGSHASHQPHYGGGHKTGGLLNKAMAVGGGVLGAKALSKGVGGLGGGKALKYGLPIAGVGLGGYMLSKGLGDMCDSD